MPTNEKAYPWSRHTKELIEHRLNNIETSLKHIEGRDAILARIQFNQEDHEKRLTEIEKAKTLIIRMVLGTVGVALLSLVIGTRVQL